MAPLPKADKLFARIVLKVFSVPEKAWIRHLLAAMVPMPIWQDQRSARFVRRAIVAVIPRWHPNHVLMVSTVVMVRCIVWNALLVTGNLFDRFSSLYKFFLPFWSAEISPCHLPTNCWQIMVWSCRLTRQFCFACSYSFHLRCSPLR